LNATQNNKRNKKQINKTTEIKPNNLVTRKVIRPKLWY